jgi:hypothetical protein
MNAGNRGATRISRRDFVKSATASGIALSITPLAIAEEPNSAARETLPGRQGWNPAATGVGRIDGVAKVRGAKLYASDFRAADLPNWPQARRMPCSFEQRTRRTFMTASTFRA